MFGYRELMGDGRALTVYCYNEVWHDAWPGAASTDGATSGEKLTMCTRR